MFAQLAKFCLLAAVVSPVVVLAPLDSSFAKSLFFRIAVECAAALTLLSWAARQTPARFEQWAAGAARHPIVAAVLVYGAVFLLAASLAFDPSAAFWSTYARGEGAFQMLHYCAFLILLILLFRKPADWNRLFLVSLGAGAACVLYGLGWAAGVNTQVFPIDKPIEEGTGPVARLFEHQFVGSVGNPIWAGAYFLFQFGYVVWLLGGRFGTRRAVAVAGAGVGLAICGYASLSLLVRRHYIAGILFLAFSVPAVRWIRRALREGWGPPRILSAGVAGAGLFLFALLLTRSRGAVLALIAALTAGGVYLAYRREPRWVVGLLLGIILLGVAFFTLPPYAPVPFEGRNVLDLTSGFYRLEYWQVAWRGFLERPLLGWGPENFPAIYDRHGQLLWWVDRAHSIVFDALAATGAAGLLALLGIFASCAWVLYRSGFQAADSRTGGFQVGVLSALVLSYLVQGLFVFDWLVVFLQILVVLACLVWVTTPPDPPQAARRGDPPPNRRAGMRWTLALAGWAVIAGAGYLGNYLPLVKALAFERAITSRLVTWGQWRDSFDASLRAWSPYGQEELVRRFGLSIAKHFREKKLDPFEVEMWESYFRKYADPVIERRGVYWLRVLEAASEVSTAAFQATGNGEFFVTAERYQSIGLEHNPANLTLSYARFELYTAAGKKKEARRLAESIANVWPKVWPPDTKIQIALWPKEE